jgi:hypothetical protein
MLRETLPPPPPNKELLKTVVSKLLIKGAECDVEISAYYKYQEMFNYRVVESFLSNEGEAIVGQWARQSGKTRCISSLIPILSLLLPGLAEDEQFKGTSVERFKIGVRIGIFAPIKEQAVNLYSRVRRNIRTKQFKELMDHLGITLIQDSNDGIEFNNGSIINIQSAAVESKIESKTFDIVVIDEAHDVDSLVITKSISPMLASTDGTTVMIGTTSDDISDNRFYETIKSMQQSGSKNLFIFNDTVVSKYNPRYKKFLEKQKEELGENSVAYRMSYKLEWPSAEGMFLTEDQLFGMGEWEGRGIIGNHNWISERQTGIQVAGIDWAKELGDTCVSILDVDTNFYVETNDNKKYYHTKLISMLLLHGEDYEAQYGQVTEFLLKFNVVALCADATGGSVGDPLFDRLSSDLELAHITINPVKFTPTEKSRIYKQFQQEIGAGRFKIPGGHAKKTTLFRIMKNEFVGLRKKYTATRLLSVAKNPRKKDGKDDIPDSICCAIDATQYIEYGDVQQGPDIFDKKVARSQGLLERVRVQTGGSLVDRIQRRRRL